MFDRARYECALLQNKLRGTPVVPICLGQLDSVDHGAPIFKRLSFREVTTMNFSDKPHKRGTIAQHQIDELWYFPQIFEIRFRDLYVFSKSLSPEETAFLGSVSSTIQEVSSFSQITCINTV